MTAESGPCRSSAFLRSVSTVGGRRNPVHQCERVSRRPVGGADQVASVCAMSERGRPGRLVDGRFELLERLGSGGMGTVWRARDVGLHREVAIKEVRPADSALLENNPVLAAQQRER